MSVWTWKLQLSLSAMSHRANSVSLSPFASRWIIPVTPVEHTHELHTFQVLIIGPKQEMDGEEAFVY